MAGIGIVYYCLTDYTEVEVPEYNVVMNGMTPDDLFSRYIDISDDCIEMELELSFEERAGDAGLDLKGLVAKMNAVASIAFLDIPALPSFPWTPR